MSVLTCALSHAHASPRLSGWIHNLLCVTRRDGTATRPCHNSDVTSAIIGRITLACHHYAKIRSSLFLYRAVCRHFSQSSDSILARKRCQASVWQNFPAGILLEGILWTEILLAFSAMPSSQHRSAPPDSQCCFIRFPCLDRPRRSLAQCPNVSRSICQRVRSLI